MFKNTYQSGFLSILYSIGSKPLQIWEKDSKHYPIQFIMATSKDLQTRTSNLRFSKSWAPTLLLPPLPALKTISKL